MAPDVVVDCFYQTSFRWGIDTLEWSLICRSLKRGRVGCLRFRTYLRYRESVGPLGDSRPWEERVAQMQVDVSGKRLKAAGGLGLLRSVDVRSLTDIETARGLISSFVDEWITAADSGEEDSDSDWEATVQAMQQELDRFKAALISRRRTEYANVLKQHKEREDA